jgi:hypothetical protein
MMVAAMSLFLVFSCSKKEKKAESAPADTTKTVSYISEEVSFGIFFDEKGTKRSLTLDHGQKQVKISIIVSFPETLPISAVEYRLVLPQGVTIENDKYYQERVALMGRLEHGIAETFPCVKGPQLLLHTLTLNVPPGLKDAELAILPSEDGDLLGVAICDEGMSELRAASYRAVINPTE